MSSTLLCFMCLLLTATALPAASFSSEAALTCFEEITGSNATVPRNMTLALAGGRGRIVTGQTIGPLVTGTNFSLACCARRSKERDTRLQWRHNTSYMVHQRNHLIDDVAVTIIDVTNVTMNGNGLKFTCRDGRVRERSVILLVTDEDASAGPQGTRTWTPVLIMFGMILALPFLVILMRAKKFMGTM